MEKKKKDTVKRKRKQKPSARELHRPRSSDANATFALLLASLSNTPHSVIFINKCLFKLRRFLLLSQTSMTPLLALLPTLLRSTRPELACRASDIIGAASLVSFDANEEFAFDSETVEGLISLFQSRIRKVLLSACNVVLDFSTTTFAQRQVLKFSALNKLMFVFLHIFNGLECARLWSECDESLHSLKIGIKEDELSLAFLSATVVLINACEVESIPQSLSEAFLRILKQIRVRVSDQEASQPTGSLSFEVVQRGLFGASDTTSEDFISNYWEVSPFLLSRATRDPDMHDIFGAFVQSLNWNGRVPSLLSSILQHLVACFPIASDEQNILNFLNEVKDRLGCPIIYQQDIRAVKTERQSRKEMHYFRDFHSGCSKEPLYFTFDDVLKCGQAYKEGYTVALRGLEFCYQSIAAIADTLALMFGQPSVGANLYLTPPNSQGLVCHFDDHCVFVCQIFGSKQWTIFSPPSQLLPHLYDNLLGSDINCTKAGRREFFLREGDLLYIPRGFPHEAYTSSAVSDGSPGFSFHLTLSIEVEPPFEWPPSRYSSNCVHSPEEGGLCPELLVGLSSNQCVSSIGCEWQTNMWSVADSGEECLILPFTAGVKTRKDCVMMAQILSQKLHLGQRNTFFYLIDKIRTESRFMEVLSSIEVAIQKNEDPFQQIRWLWVLCMEKETSSEYNTNKSFMIEDLLSLCAQHKDKFEAAFLNVKSRFCSEVELDELLLHGNLYERQDHGDCNCCWYNLVSWNLRLLGYFPLPFLLPAFYAAMSQESEETMRKQMHGAYLRVVVVVQGKREKAWAGMLNFRVGVASRE
ncbi:hypothetical protein JHK87_035785 [Glycine soja]|nr:hypothetical protein JHK87_035785 [Glycine soja]